MLLPRAAHTETALRDGRVLIVGGFGDAGGDEASAELYHPRGGRFTFTGRMSVGRQSHTATLLAAGSVLVAGGYDPSGRRLATAELYDPATGRFSPTGSMRGPRADHTATLLTDGRVLVTGGTGPGFTFLATAEIYDPRTGTFSATGSMSVPRESATATLLRDGRVLIAGGHAGRHADITIYASSEIYDPATGRFTRSGDMTIPRHKHDAVRLNDGRVLIVGGSDARDDHGLYASAELFDPSTDTFSPAGSLLEGRYKMRGTSLLLADGTALVCCGAARAEAFDPATDRFSALSGNLGIGPLFAAAARIGSRSVLVTGGYSLSGPATNLAWILRG
ncbi:MAG TPA: kelch repeat-containing protein [Actinomycetota bacterium]